MESNNYLKVEMTMVTTMAGQVTEALPDKIANLQHIKGWLFSYAIILQAAMRLRIGVGA